MSEICINIAKVTNEPENFKKYMKAMKTQMTELSSIKSKIDLGASTGSIKKSIENVSDALNQQYSSMNSLTEKLEVILREYQQTEKGLIGAAPDKKNTSEPESNTNNNENTDDDSYFENAIQQALMGEFYEGETNLLGDILSVIISFVPGLNCIADIRDLAADIMNALKDGKLSGKEIAVLALDVITLVGDAISLGALVKGIKGATKATKVAKTAQKASAKQAKKAAKVAAKDATTAAKEAAEKGTRKTVRKATKTAQNAATKADEAKAAKDAAKAASKEHTKKVAEETAKQVKEQTKENVKDALNKDAGEITNDVIKEEFKKDTRTEMKANK